MKASIAGIGSYVPEKILTNLDLEKMVETSDEWITTRSGIKERHIAADDQAASDLSLIAGQRALKAAHLKPKDIGAIIVATGFDMWDLPTLVFRQLIICQHIGLFGNQFIR